MLMATDQSQAPNAARTPEERAFLHAVEFSDVPTVKCLLAENPNLRVDVIDALGRTALRLAVRNENRELVDMLLGRCNNQNIHEAVLQAISEDHTSIAELILKHPKYMEIDRKRKQLGDTDEFFKTEIESQFSTDMTPLNLAAQKNNFAIVQLLLQRRERIQKPHKFSCACIDCRNRMKFDQLRVANFRLNAYRGLASDAYISLATEDPFLSAFQLAKELRNLSDDEKHFKKQYKVLANSLSNYVVKLLDRVWTQQELQLVLNKKGSADDERYDNLARLKMALQNKEKKFATHPSVQQHLVKIWHQGLGKLDTLGSLSRYLHIVGLALFYPFVIFTYFFLPNKRWAKLARQPMVKFMGHTLSFLIFLLLILVTSFWSKGQMVAKKTLKTQYGDIANEYQEYRNVLDSRGAATPPMKDNFPIRPTAASVSEIFLAIWIAGMVVQESQQLAKAGARAHFSDLVNFVDFCLLSLYSSSLLLFNWTYYKTKTAVETLQGWNASMMISYRQDTDAHIYWLNADRHFWKIGDPTSVAEDLFAIASIISFSRIANLLTANEALGPMKISLGRMIGDFLKFAFFAGFAILAFIVSLRNLYWYFGDTDYRKSPRADNVTDAASSFQDFITSFRTVFWWIYGRGAMKDTLNVPVQYENEEFRQVVGQFIAAIYHISVIIVFVNLLIAMMARSFEKIVGDVDTEWKFARSLLYMEYISEGCILPVPLNIMEPARDAMIWLITWAQQRSRQDKGIEEMGVILAARRGGRAFNTVFDEGGKSSSSEQEKKVDARKTSSEQLTYKDVMQNIVQRYIFDIQREEELGTNNLDEIRQNIFRTKWDFTEMMENRDNTARHANACLKAVASELTTLMPAIEARRLSYGMLEQLNETEVESDDDTVKTM